MKMVEGRRKQGDASNLGLLALIFSQVIPSFKTDFGNPEWFHHRSPSFQIQSCTCMLCMLCTMFPFRYICELLTRPRSRARNIDIPFNSKHSRKATPLSRFSLNIIGTNIFQRTTELFCHPFKIWFSDWVATFLVFYN